MNDPRGSKWRKWDLHIHSPLSALNNNFPKNSDGTPQWDIYFKRLRSLTDISVIGITDYYSVDGYKKTLEENKKNNFENIDLFLPNVELRTLPETGSGRGLNVHVIFSPEIVNDIESKFLSKLNHQSSGEEVYSCNERGLIRLGRSHENDEDLPERKAFEKGVEQCRLSLKDIKDILHGDSLLRKNSLVFVSNSSSDGGSGISHQELANLREELYKFSNGIFSGNPEDRKYFLGEKKNKNGEVVDPPESIKKNYGDLMPCIHGSDAHCIERISVPCALRHKHDCFQESGEDCDIRYCWIKADPTFDGLRQIVYEPKDRVRIQEIKPEEKPDYTIIDRVEYKNNNGENEKVLFNSNLNSIIGSRATGKSNLLKNIAFAIDPEQCKQKGVYKEGKDQDFLPLDDFKVFWKDKKTNTLKTEEVKEKGVLIIPQQFLGKVVYEGEREYSFDEFLSGLFENNQKFKDALQQYRNFEVKNSSEINSLIGGLITLQEDIRKVGEQLKKLGNIDEVDREIKKLEAKIKEIRKKGDEMSEENIKKHQKLVTEKRVKEKESAIIQKNIQGLEYLQRERVITPEILLTFEFSEEYRKQVEKALTKSEKNFKEEFVKKEINKLQDRSKGIKGKIKKLEKDIVPLRKSIEMNKSLLELTKQREKQEEFWEKITEHSSLLKNFRQDYKKKISEVIEIYVLFENEFLYFDNIDIGDFQFSSVNFVPVYNVGSMKEFISENINRRDSIDFKEKEKVYSNAVPFLKDSKDWEYGRRNLKILLKELLIGILSGDLLLKAGKDTEIALIELFKNRYKIDYSQSVKNQERGGDEFPKMSDGEKMMVLLEFIFEFDDYNYPVLLDQPEDDLDARAIAKQIVNFLKTQKEKRQVIIASHNANLVIVGDSEEVLVAEKSGRQQSPNFRYKTGSIENENINREIIDVLEGGRDALKKRRDKLNIEN